MRPESYKELSIDKCCATCKYLKEAPYKRDDLCCFGDKIEEYKENGRISYLAIDGVDVGLADGDEYDNLWAGRTVFCPSLSVCDNWEKNEGKTEISFGRII